MKYPSLEMNLTNPGRGGIINVDTKMEVRHENAHPEMG